MAFHRISCQILKINASLVGEAGYVDVVALLDTGASMTAIHPRLVELLNPTPLGTIDVKRVGGQMQLRPTYYFTIAFEQEVRQFAIEAVAEAPASDCDILIGRDFMSLWAMMWDGPADRLVISY